MPATAQPFRGHVHVGIGIPCRTTTLEGATVHGNVVTNDSKATVSVLYWYGNYPTH
jgi:hypothetical protein